MDDDLNFEFDEDIVLKNGCGATLRDQFWYFGGDPFEKQVKINEAREFRAQDINEAVNFVHRKESARYIFS